jgi:hypothetical protein
MCRPESSQVSNIRLSHGFSGVEKVSYPSSLGKKGRNTCRSFPSLFVIRSIKSVSYIKMSSRTTEASHKQKEFKCKSPFTPRNITTYLQLCDSWERGKAANRFIFIIYLAYNLPTYRNNSGQKLNE